MKIDLGKAFARIIIINILPVFFAFINTICKEDEAAYVWGLNRFFSMYCPTLICVLLIAGIIYSVNKLL